MHKWKLRINTYLHVSQDACVFREEALSFPQDSISPTLKEVKLYMEIIPNIGDLVKEVIAGVSVFNQSVDIDSKVLFAFTN